MSSDVLIAGDHSQKDWVEIALGYMPEEILREEGRNLAIVGLGSIGGCRLPQQYRQREIVVLSDWIYPPAGDSEGDPAGRFFIVTVLHEIAHAVCRHKSPTFDKLTNDEIQSQENEADSLAIGWFNSYVKLRDAKYLRPIQTAEFRDLVERYATLYSDTEHFKADWHRVLGA